MSDLAADQLQRSSSIGTGAQNAKTPAFNDLMDDVVMEIATYLPRSIDVLNFGLTERRVLPCVMPSLYSSVHLPPELCSATLNMLSKRPDRTCLIRSLVVEPDEMEGLPDGVPLSALLADMASHMQALCTFIWKGRAIPLHDRLWLQLRVSCPRLCRVGVSIGSRLPSPVSHLYDFNNLTGFYVTLHDQFFETHGGPDEHPSLSRLWDMLLTRCPLLEELTMDGVSSSRPTAAYRLVQGRWPSLRKLYLGDVLTEPPTPAVLNPQSKRLLISFLDEHSTLEHLQLSAHVNLHPVSFQGIQRSSLQRLEHFSGSIFHASTLRSYRSLRSLRLDEPLHLRHGILPAFCAVLDHFPGLESLSVSLLVDTPDHARSFLETAFGSSTQLRSLTLYLGVLPFISMSHLSEVLTLMPKLKHIELGLVPISANETLYKSASTLAMDHQCLREISLVFLPHGMILERGRKPRRDISGFFQVVVDEREQPVALIVTEETWFGMGSLPRKRRCVQLLSDEHKSKRMEYAPWASWIIMLPWLTVVAAMVIRLRR